MAIVAVAKLVLQAKALQLLFRASKDFIQETVPELAEKYEKELNDKLQKIVAGEKFLDVVDVVHVDQDFFYPLVRFEDTEVSIVPGLKIDLIRATLKVEKKINLTDSSEPPVVINSVPAYAFHLSLERPDYGLAVGGGEDQLAGFRQMLVAVRWDAIPLRLEGYYAEADHGGFVISIHTDLPFPIPLANTGFGLCGIGLTYGERFAPKLTEVVIADPIEELRKASAQDLVNWARKNPLEQWVPAKANIRIFGLHTDIGDMATAGCIIRFDRVGLTYITYGPSLVLGGKLLVLRTLPLGESLGAIHVPSRSVFLSNSASLPICDLMKISGKVEYSASLKDQNKSWVAVGGYSMDGARLEILNIFELWGGSRLVPLQGFAMRSGARIRGEGKLLGFGGGFSLSIDIMGSVGWNPIELAGQLNVDGYIWVKLFGKELGIGASATLSLRLPKPLELNFRIKFRIKIWFAKISVTVTIFNLNDKTIQAALAPLQVLPGAPLSFVHRANGSIGVINDQANPNNEVPPDVSFDIPFQRIAGGVAGVATNATAADGTQREGGIDVLHWVTDLRIVRLNEETGEETDVPGVRAAWLGLASGELIRRSSRLAIPCANPLSWLQSFEYASPGSAQPQLDSVFQTFGVGPNESISPPVLDFGKLRLEGNNELLLWNLYRVKPYDRGIFSQALLLSVSAGSHASNEFLAVRRYDLRVVASDEIPPKLHVSTGQVQTVKVRDLANGFVEWSAIVTRSAAEAKQPLQVVSGTERPFTLVAIGYEVDWTADVTWDHETVFAPGVYKLYLDGQTSTAVSGKAGPSTPWAGLVEQFRVVAPKNLRPYLRYATNGDERIFSAGMPVWNPNPLGIGFGHYKLHLGAVRSRVGYLSNIFPSVWVQAIEGAPPVECPVVDCSDGTIAGTTLSQEWDTTFNGPLMKEQEFTYPLPLDEGIHRMMISAVRSVSGELELVDEWSYRVSRFDLPSRHLEPRQPHLARAYGPFGTREIDSKPIAIDSAHLTGVDDAKLQPGWALPSWIQEDFGLTAKAGLTFLKIVEWSGHFRAPSPMHPQRLIVPADQTELGLVFDNDERPAFLLWRTPEPLDWRRVELNIYHGNRDFFEQRFSTNLTPSPDGTSCLIALEAERVAVRIPAGLLALEVRFHYASAHLPTLINATDAAATQDQLTIAFTQPVGPLWPVLS